MKNKTYDILKKITLSAGYVAAFVASVAEIVGFPYGAIIAAIITAAGTCLGQVIEVSSKHYWNEQAEENDAQGVG